ncbi:trypsin-like peptidase domain-containing protein [Nostoc sp. CHAB 5844]|nr:trypsin-like peptidase domain-containing protein [Nostoc sp. CHAB 5844]
MPLYRVMNKIFTDEKTVKTICKVVNDQGICTVITSNIPQTGTILDFTQEKTKIDGNKLAAIIKLRKPGTKPFRYLSVGDPDYLPFSFLERGWRCGKSVCLLTRFYFPQEVMDIIGDYSIDEYPRIINILSQELSLEQGFWEKLTKVSDAWKDDIFKTCMEKNRNKRILVPIATGFLVGRNYLLTNHHVLSSQEEAKDFVAQFQYETDELDKDKNCINYKLDPSFFKSNEALDYTLVKLHSLTEAEREENKLAFLEAGDNFGWLQMLREDTSIAPTLSIDDAQRIQETLPEAWANIPQELQKKALISGLSGEPVNIVQHPRGRAKEIVLSDNRVQFIYDNYLEYAADADFGSSGSPVFNVQWQLIALHHAALIESNDEEKQIKVRGNVGIRIHQIIADLENNQAGTTDFINEFIDKKVRQNKRVYILAGRQRNQVFERTEDVELEAKITKDIGKEIVKILQLPGFDPQLVPDEHLNTQEDAIAWINQKTKQDYQIGDVAIEILTNYSSQPQIKPVYYAKSAGVNSEARGATVFYIQFKKERKIHAEMLLNSLLKIVPELPSRGAQPDTAAINQGLDFCRNIKMPSLDLFVGYLSSSQDVELLQNRTHDLASGIANGIVEWSQNLCPQPQKP